jgi:monodehydroascorbate reductase (NADH)
MEVAAALSGHGIPTSIVLPGPHLLSRLFTPKIAEFYEKFYEGETIHHVF